MNARRTTSAFFVAGLVAIGPVLAPSARGAEPDAIEVKPATAPAVAPATGPSTAPADSVRIAPEAQQLLKEVADAYAGLKGLDVAGALSHDLQAAGRKNQGSTPFGGSFEAPNKFHHALKDGIVIGSTGSAVYSFLAENNTYTTESAPKDRPALEAMPEPAASLLRDQNPSLLLALTSDPQSVFTQGAASISRPIDTTLDGVAYPTLNVRKKDHESVTILVDPKTHLLRQWQRDLKQALEEHKTPDVIAATITIDYQKSTATAPAEAAQFAWVPPSGARNVSAGTPAEMEDNADVEAMSLIGKPAPAFTLQDTNGKTVSLADAHGSVVILDFWATWCGPCRKALPHLNRFYDEHKDSGLKVFAINIDEPETRPEIPKTIADLKLTLPVLLDTKSEAAKAYKVQPIPMTVVVGKDGVVKRVFIGLRPGAEDELRKAVADAGK